MKNWLVLGVLIVILLGAGVVYRVLAPVDPDPRPNFVVIIADDLSWNDLGAYGNQDVVTPNIDQLAEQGLRFTHAFLTTSSCSASRASILTGKHPHSNGLINLHQALPGSELTLGQMLGDAGYFTAAAGKWHVGGEVAGQFDRVYDLPPDNVLDSWLRLFRERPSGRPFFFWLAAHDPHLPHTRGTPLQRQYDHTRFTLPHGFVNAKGLRRELQAFYLEVSRFDQDVGRVLDELSKRDLLDNTVVLVMADNGRPFPRGKLSLYDGGIRTPFILHWPRGIPRPGDYEFLISAVDIAPTFLELAGADIPPHLPGVSFAAVLTEPHIKVRDFIFAQRNWHVEPAHERAVRSLDYLYKENQFPIGGDCVRPSFGGSIAFKALRKAYREGRLSSEQQACFDQRRAPVELFAVGDRGVHFKNLAAESEYASVRNLMAKELSDWRVATGDFDFELVEEIPSTVRDE